MKQQLLDGQHGLLGLEQAQELVPQQQLLERVLGRVFALLPALDCWHNRQI
jgi:hypothetical protein